MLALHAAFLGLLAGTQLFFTALEYLNLRYTARTVRDRAEWVRTELDVDDPAELLAYERAGTRVSLAESWAVLVALLALLYSGGFAALVDASAALPYGIVGEGVGFLLALVVGARLLGLPFDAYDTFVVEERFGFNEQSVGLWLRDAALGLAITVVLTGVLAAVILWFVATLPTLWPALGWAAVFGFSLLMLVLYPRVIAPLFNDFEPVEAGDLREAVEAVFDRAGFACEQVYEMDASRRSSHSNAYFVGFGEAKRVVLFDTLVERMDLPEVQAVLAHELAHWKRAHVWKQVGASGLQFAVVFAALAYLVDAGWLYAMFGVPRAPYAGLVLGGLWVWPLLRWTAPLQNRLSLAHEYEADAFAVETVGSGPMADALRRLAGENLSNPFPHPLYATFHYTHPPIPERLRHIESEDDDAAPASGAAPG
jgi:STE24 endopeptidase